MKLNDIVQFLKLLGVGEIKISDEEEWVRCSCPLAAFTHFKGKDEHPSFGVKANDVGESGYNCFTCGTGRLWDLIHKMNFTTGIPKRAAEFFGHAEIFDAEQVTMQESRVGGYYDDVYTHQFLNQKKIKVPQEVLDLFPLLETTIYTDHKAEIEAYFLSRGIPPHILYDFGIRHEPNRHWVIFPIYDTDGIIYRLHVKLVKEKTFFYVTPDLVGMPDVPMWGRKDYWFGIQFYDPILPVLLVESETDVMRLRALGVENVMATCGPLNKYKADRLINRSIYLGFDSDEPGSKYYNKALAFLKGRDLYKLNWDTVEVSYFTPKKKQEKKRQAKDGGDLETREQYDYILDKKIAVGRTTFNPVKGYVDVWK